MKSNKRHEMNNKLHGFVLSLFFLIVALQFSLNALAATELKIITLQHRFAEDVLPYIQALTSNDGAVTGMQNHLIIRASPEKMIEIEQVIASLDVVRQNLKITVSIQGNLHAERDGLAVNGRKRIGNVEIGTNQYPRSSTDEIQVAIEKNQSNMHSSSNQFINVVDGERAFIRVGQSVPFTQEWVTLTRRYGSASDITVQRITEFADISTGFSVRPRSIGQQIELEITPRIAQLNQSGFIDFKELTTVIRVNKGEWLDLAGMMQQKDDVSRAILRKQTSAQSQNDHISIQVE